MNYEKWYEKLTVFLNWFDGYTRNSSYPLKRLTTLYERIEETVFGKVITISWTNPDVNNVQANEIQTIEANYEEWYRKCLDLFIWYEGYTKNSPHPSRKLITLLSELEEIIFGETQTQSWSW